MLQNPVKLFDSGTEGGTVDYLSQQCTDNEVSSVTVPDVVGTFGSLVEADGDNGVANVTVPEVGMTFGSPDEAYEFYRDYSCKVGFGITKRSSHKSHGILYNATFSCNKCRNYKKVPPEEGSGKCTSGVLGTGCQARINLKTRSLGYRSIERVVLEHNHELSPNSVNLMRRRPQLSLFLKNQLEINGLVGLGQNKSITAVFTQDGGVTKCHLSRSRAAKRLGLGPNKAFSEKDMRLVLREGDAAALKNHFDEQQLQCADFFYSYDV